MEIWIIASQHHHQILNQSMIREGKRSLIFFLDEN
jgi:hypothetical protein